MPVRKVSKPPSWEDYPNSLVVVRLMQSHTGTFHIGVRKIATGNSNPSKSAVILEDGSFHEPCCGYMYKAEYAESWASFSDFLQARKRCKKCEALMVKKNGIFEEFSHENMVSIFNVYLLRRLSRKFSSVRLEDIRTVFIPMEEQFWCRFREFEAGITHEIISRFYNQTRNVVLDVLRFDRKSRLEPSDNDLLTHLQGEQICVVSDLGPPFAPITKDVTVTCRDATVTQLMGRLISVMCAEAIYIRLSHQFSSTPNL